MANAAKKWLIGAVAAAVLLVVLAVGIGVMGNENGKQFDAVPVLRTEEELRAAMEKAPEIYILEGVPLGGGTLTDKLGVLPAGEYLHIQYIHQKAEYDAGDDGGYEWKNKDSERLDAEQLYLWGDISLEGDWQWSARKKVEHYPTGKTRASRGNERTIIHYVPDGAAAVLCVRAGNGRVTIDIPCDNGNPIVMVNATLKSFRSTQMSETAAGLVMVSAAPTMAMIFCLIMYNKKRHEPVKPDRTL